MKRIRWGGTRLGSVLGKPLGPHTDYAESWEIADHGDDQSIVEGGPFAGWRLRQLVERKNAELFGRHAGLQQFPLLIKFLDACDRLSVQVHPDDEQARRYDPAENGKTEAWVIIEAAPESRLYAGLRAGIDRRRLQEALDEGRVEECLHSFGVQRGDCVFIPAGTVHAIGEGILLAEIQQMSDLTFRLYDWGRLEADGTPRPLHIRPALDCIDFARGPVAPVVPKSETPLASKQWHEDRTNRREELVRCDHFVLHRHTVADPLTVPADTRFHVLITLSGSLELECEGGRLQIGRGRTVLVPASSPPVRIVPHEESILLEAFLP